VVLVDRVNRFVVGTPVRVTDSVLLRQVVGVRVQKDRDGVRLTVGDRVLGKEVGATVCDTVIVGD
jgi:hypothetical protein